MAITLPEARLADPDTRCDAAADLAAGGRPESMVAILRVYDANPETDRLCLLRAIKTLAAGDAVLALAKSDDPETRRTAYRVMELVPDGRWLAPLRDAVATPTYERVALSSLVAQVRTPEWEAVMIGLLDAPSRNVRAEAVRVLTGRKNARAALEAHAKTETDPEIRAALEKAIAG